MNESPTTIAPVAEPLPEEQEYRSLSAPAVLALLMGLASALALAHPLLAIVPLGAAALAAVALRSIAAGGSQVSGKTLAVAGLCLATLFFGWGVAAHLHHQTTVRQRAREFADDWLKILATGDLRRAHQLHVAREFRLDPQSQMDTVYKTNEEAESSFTAFFQDPAVKQIIAAGPQARFHFVEVAHQTRQSLADEVVIKYEVEGPQDTIPFWITVRRTFKNLYRNADWEILTIRDEPPSL